MRLPVLQNVLEMNLRHAAALALIGWYLMTPPPSNKENAPLSQWTIIGSYDSAKECEATKKKNQDFAASKMKQFNEKYRRMTDEERAALLRDEQAFQEEMLVGDALADALEAVCVSTDDPRLKEK